MRFVFGSHGDLGSSAPPNSLGCVPVPLDLGPRRLDLDLDYHDSLSIQRTMLRLSSSINKTLSVFLMLIRIWIPQAHRITTVALHLGVFLGIIIFLKEALW